MAAIRRCACQALPTRDRPWQYRTSKWCGAVGGGPFGSHLVRGLGCAVPLIPPCGVMVSGTRFPDPVVPVSFPALIGGVHDVRVQGRPASVLHGTANIALSPYRSPTDRSYCRSR